MMMHRRARHLRNRSTIPKPPPSSFFSSSSAAHSITGEAPRCNTSFSLCVGVELILTIFVS